MHVPNAPESPLTIRADQNHRFSLPNVLWAVIETTIPRSVENWLTVALVLAFSVFVPASSVFSQLADQAKDDPKFAKEIENTRKTRLAKFSNPALIEFKGDIDDALLVYFQNRLEQAKNRKADVVIVEIESGGGYLNESMEIAETLKNVDWAHTVAFIPKEAYSGAAIVSFGCDETIIAEDGKLGDIGVISFDPTLFAFRYAEAKFQSAFIREARDLAVAKGRSPDLVEAMIDKDVAIFFRVDADGKYEFKTKPIKANEDLPDRDGEWELLPDSGVEKFLTINGLTAVQFGLADEHASDRDQLIAALNIDGRLTVYERRFSDRLAYFLCNPWITGILIIIGLVSLYIELSAPGIGAGGVVATLCAVLFFWSRFVGGTAGWLEVVLFVTGVLFLILEIFVIPGWGVSGILGLFLLFASALLASQNFYVPETGVQWNKTLTTLLVFACSLTVVAIVGGVISKRMGSIPVLNRLILAPQPDLSNADEVDKQTGKPLQKDHPIVSVGDWGESESVLRPAGRAKFAGRSVDVVSEGEFIDPGQPIRVLSIRGNVVVVESVENHDTAGVESSRADSADSPKEDQLADDSPGFANKETVHRQMDSE